MAGTDLKDRLLSAGADLIVPVLLLGYSTHYYLGVRALPQPGTNLLLIEPVYVILLVSCVLFAAFRVLHAIRGGAADPDAPPVETIEPRRSVVFVVLTVAYAVLIPVAGFVTTSSVYIVAMCWALGIRSLPLLVSVSVGVVAALWLSMEYWLGIPLPRGFLF